MLAPVLYMAAVVSLSPAVWMMQLAPKYAEADPDAKYETTTDHDLYVIRAMVYEVGILTNATGNHTENSTDRGEHVALTFYHNNGSDIDFSKIPEPLYTNLTGYSVTATAAVLPNGSTFENRANETEKPVPGSFKDIVRRFDHQVDSSESGSLKSKHWPSSEENSSSDETLRTSSPEIISNATHSQNRKRETGSYLNMNSSQLTDTVNGTVLLPSEAALQSIAIPPLLTLNGNLSEIPVPISTSIINFSTLSTHAKAINGNLPTASTSPLFPNPETEKPSAHVPSRRMRSHEQYNDWRPPVPCVPNRTLQVSSMNSPNLNERCSSSMSISNTKKLLSNESKEESLDNSARESASERTGANKGEEDWHRRTIIVERKNGSYGFTLQSYGIHYKKEQEIEMITYVDFVEKQGPAAAAGMREGDVIVAVNGTDMERADHQAIVSAINGCDTRMRMVVIFEDCVRKVELHIKYIKLQQVLQEKLRELDKLKIRERHVLDSNWKTHSLPSQKKKNSPGDPTSDVEDASDNRAGSYCRPTLSSENVTTTNPHNVAFKYQYLDPIYGACIIQPDVRSGNFLITVGSPRNRGDCRHFVVKTPGDPHRSSDGRVKEVTSNGTHQSQKKAGHGHGCACIPVYNNCDANSLDAYDLASPCCDPHCVPNARRKHRRKKECSKEKRKERMSQFPEKSYQKMDSSSQTRAKKTCSSANCPGNRYRYLNTESVQTSQCSLQSYNSNATVAQQQSCENSASSYSTSLSSDTLFWDNDRSESRASPKIHYQHSQPPQYKPKSWDNLTTKAVGGYGFGYGYLDTITKHVSRSKSHGRTHSSRSTQSHHGYHSHSHRQSAAPAHYSLYEHDHRHCFQPTKSTESLIVQPKSNHRTDAPGSDPRLSCNWAGTSSHGTPNGQVEYYRRSSVCKSPNDSRSSGYYSHHFVYPAHSYHKKEKNVSSEITRL